MSDTWTTVITPKTKLFDIPLRELKQYRGLIYTLVKRNYEVQYKQTILGPLWMIFGLIFNSGIFSFIFGYVGNFSSDGTPYFLFYMSGSIVWDLFSACFGSNTGVFMDNAYLYGKVYFPRLVVPIANSCFQVFKTFIKFLVCVVVWAIFMFRGETSFSGFGVLLFVPASLIAILMGTAAGLIIASMTVKYRDFSHLTGIAMTLLLYASPVMYSINTLPEWLQKLVLINPMSSVIEMFRFAMTGDGIIHWWAVIYSFIFSLVVGLVGLVMFNQTEKTFIDLV